MAIGGFCFLLEEKNNEANIIPKPLLIKNNNCHSYFD